MGGVCVHVYVRVSMCVCSELIFIYVQIEIFEESDFFLILIYLILFINCLIAWGFLIRY